ncbi:RNI-like protein [Pisolithus croceorrhizus]|nr:RNI-like protein [Pisolithus croceorrhizus]
MHRSRSYTALPKGRRGTFGAATEDDLLTGEPRQIPSASALSVRTLASRGPIPTLTTLAARRFVENIRTLSSDERLWRYVRVWLKRLPDIVVPKLFIMLQRSCPKPPLPWFHHVGTHIRHSDVSLVSGLIGQYFLRGPSVHTIQCPAGCTKADYRLCHTNDTLHELCLLGFDKYPDSFFASLVSSLPQLRILVLRGCTKVSVRTAKAAKVNFNYTGVTPASLGDILNSCSSLEVLKVAGISSWANAVFTNLRNLKLRQLSLSDASDVSFTHVRRSPFGTNSIPALEKLTLTSINMPPMDIVTLIASLPHLQTLALGALGGGGQGSFVAVGNISAMSMTDEALALLTDRLVVLKDLEKGNGALADFVRKAGRRLKQLNLSGLPNLRSGDMTSEDPPRLEELSLNHTGVDDEAAPYLSRCSSLVSLSAGLFPIIDACPKLEQRIKIADRRRFFDVWEEDWKDT